MSTTVESRVVEMRFDNGHFERNVSNTMSTLDKLKSKLNFSGSAKGLNDVSAAAKNVDMNGLARGVETVSTRFSAMQVIGVTALANITNSAVNAGKRIVSALTIDPIKTGLQEYETQINAVQTILANTESKGTTIDDVNAALEELNAYADKTIYNFTEMTRNIGTFTAAGVDLDTSVSAIQGIANLAAVSGSTSQQASTAMYQLSQALATGTVKLMDWNSVVNAGMGGEVFQNALIRTAAVMAGASEDVEAWRKENIDSFGSFRDSLTQGGWLTTDVLTETLNQFTMAAEEGSEEWEAYKKSLMDTGYTEAQAKAILKMANTATDAATKVKTFTQLWDVLKESAQSGWAQTWKLIIGDFEQAKNMLSPLADFLTNIINGMSKFRNDILESALGRGLSGVGDKISSLLKPATKAADTVKSVVETVADLGKVVDEVILGKFGNGQERFDALTKAGINYCEVQNKVNEKLGDSYRYTQEEIDAQNKLLGVKAKTTETTEEQAEATVELNDEQKKLLKDLGKMSDAQLKAAGYSEAQIKALKDLKKVAEDLGIPFDTFIDQLDQINGRWLMINSFKNIGLGLVDIGKAIGQAWQNVFPEHTVENFADKLFNLLGSFHKLTSAMRDVFFYKAGTKVTDGVEEDIYVLTEAGKKLVRTFEGVFAIIDIVSTVVGGAFKIAFKVAAELLDRFDVNILDVTAAVGDAIVGFRDWVDSIISISDIVDVLAPMVEYLAGCVNTFVEAFKGSEYLTAFIDRIKSIGTAIKEWVGSLKDSENIPADIIAGLAKGIRDGVPQVIAAIVDLAKALIEGFCEMLGIHSPSKVMIELGGDTVEGLKVGIEAGIDGIVGIIKTLANKIVEAFKAMKDFITGDREAIDWGELFGESAIAKVFTSIADTIANAFKKLWQFITDTTGKIDWGNVFAGGILVSIAWFLKQIATATSGIADALGGLGDLMDNAGRVLKSFSKVLNSYSWELKAEALKKMAIAVAILVAALVVLTEIDDIGKMWNAVGIIGALAGILVVMAFAMDKLGQVSVDLDGKKIEGLRTGLMRIGLVIMLLAVAVKLIGDMTPDEAKQGFLGLAGIAVGLLAFLAVIGLISRYSKDVDQIGSLMTKLAIALILMIGVVKLASGLSASEIGNGVFFAGAFILFVNAITSVAKSSGNNVSKVGGMILKLAIAMGLMVGVVKMVSLLSVEEMLKGAAFAAGFTLFVAALVHCTKIGKKQQIAKIGGLVLSISFSLTLLVGVCKLIGKLSIGDMIKGAAFVAGFIVMLKVLISVLTIGNEQKMAQVTGTILAMATAIAILAAVSVALGFVDLAGLAKGILAVGALSLFVTMMVKALKGAQNVKGSIMMMAIAIGVMAGAIFALSLIEDTSSLMAAAGALAIVMGMFALIEKNAKKINKSMVAIGVMTVAVGLLATILYFLTNNISDPNAAIQTAIALGILLGALGASMNMLGGLGKNSMLAMPAMYAMVGVLALVAVVVGVLEALDVAPSLETALSLSILLIALAGVTAILTTIGVGAPAALGGIAAFAIVVAGVGLLMAAIGALNEHVPKLEEWLDSGIGILQKIGEGIGSFIGGFIGGIGEGMMDSLNDMIDTFGDIVDKLVEISDTGTNIKTEGFDGVEKLLEVLGSIGMATVGTSFSDIFTLGGTSMEKFQTDGVAFFNAMKAIAEASTGITIDEAAMDSVIGVAQSLADLQGSLEPIGGVITWFTGRDDLATFGTNIGAFIESMKTALSSLDGYSFDSATFYSVVVAAQSLADLQGSLEPIGGVITWFTGRDDLGTFGTNVGAFIESMKTALTSLGDFTFNTEALNGLITAATDLAGLQASLEPIGGVITWFTGRDDLGTFGINIGAFISSMKTALSSLEGATLDEAALTSVITAAEKLAGLQEKLEPMGGVISWFTGRDDLGTFGTNIATFASAIGTLKTAMGEGGITEETINSITNTGTALIELQKALPEEHWFDGKMDLSTFSDYISDFGEAMGNFADTASGIDSAAVGTAISTAYRIKTLITSLTDLDTSGLTAFTGIGTGGFGADGAAYKIAQAMSAFSEEVAGLDTTAVSTSVTVAGKLKTLISGLVGLDTSGIENFKPESIGSSMKTYGDKVKNIDTSVVSSSISAANRLKNFIVSLSGIDVSGIANFKVDTIGKALKGYSSSISGFKSDAVSSSISAANRLKNFISSLGSLDTSGVGSFKAALDELSTVNISSIVKAFSGASDKLSSAGVKMMDGLIRGLRSRSSAVQSAITHIMTSLNNEIKNKIPAFERAGATMATRLAGGISSKKGAARSAVLSCLASAVSAARTGYSSMYSAGTYLGSGLVSGVNSKKTAAYNAGYALGQAAVQGEKDGQASNSPSKLTIQAGKWLGEGLVIGIGKMSRAVYNSGSELGNAATNSISSTVSRIADMVSTDIDAQPTIRPVLDLSNVRTGAGAISDMLGGGYSMGILANANAISASMNRNRQNATNDDVVYAINRLRKDLGDIGNTTYSINGITYDDGSNVSEAIKSIARYAIMERRS